MGYLRNSASFWPTCSWREISQVESLLKRRFRGVVLCGPWQSCANGLKVLTNTEYWLWPAFGPHTLHMLLNSAHAEITWESVANGFVLEIEGSKLPSGKTNRRFWTFVFSSRATRRQTSTALSDCCAFRHKSELHSYHPQEENRHAPHSLSQESEMHWNHKYSDSWKMQSQTSRARKLMTECCIVHRNLNHK